MTIFRGSGVALATPMKEDGSINYDSMEKLIEAWSEITGSYPIA